MVMEGKSATISGLAGGAQKIYWLLKRNGKEEVAAVDCLEFRLEAGRVTGDQSFVLEFRAIYPDGIKTKDIAVTIKEDVADPVFSIKAPEQWDGRKTIEVIPEITNIAELRAKGAGKINIQCEPSDFAITMENTDEKVILTRAQKSGELKLTFTLDNGGHPVTHSCSIFVNEPKSEPWVSRPAAQDEQPQENQFYARNDKNEGTLYYTGSLKDSAAEIFLKVYADDKPYTIESLKPADGKSYSFSVKLKPGLIKYKVELGIMTGGHEKILRTIGNIVCGDAYLIDGQSNAEAVEFGSTNYPFTSEWIRTYGCTDSDPQKARLKLWGPAQARSKGGRLQIG